MSNSNIFKDKYNELNSLTNSGFKDKKRMSLTNRINTSYDRKMFEKKPLKNDATLEKKLNKLKECQKQQEIYRMKKEKGFKPKNIEQSLDEYRLKKAYNSVGMKNDDEVSGFKNTFTKFNKLTTENTNKRKTKHTFLIKIDNESRKLEVNFNDDIRAKVYAFSNELGLDEDESNALFQQVYNKMMKLKQGNI